MKSTVLFLFVFVVLLPAVGVALATAALLGLPQVLQWAQGAPTNAAVVVMAIVAMIVIATRLIAELRGSFWESAV